MVFEEALRTLGRWTDSLIKLQISAGWWNLLIVPIELLSIIYLHWRFFGVIRDP